MDMLRIKSGYEGKLRRLLALGIEASVPPKKFGRKPTPKWRVMIACWRTGSSVRRTVKRAIPTVELPGIR